jgi:hypothetical protein
MPSTFRDRPWLRTAGRGALAFWLLLNAAACDTTTMAADGGSPFLLTTRGDPVRAYSPPGVEVTLGSKRVLPAGEPVPRD